MHFVTKKLREEYDVDEYRAFMEVLDKLEDQRVTEVEVLLDALPSERWDRENLIECMQELANFYHLGRFVKGARGKRSRIEWGIQPRIIARAALGENDELSALLFAKEHRQTSEHYAGKHTWTYQELVTLAANTSGVDPDSIVVDLKIGEAKEILAKSQAIEIHEVSISLG